MKRIVTTLLTVVTLLCCLSLNAQDCECTNCPVPIQDNGTFEGYLDVNVSGPNDLSLCPLQQVCFTINHTWVGDLAVTLTSPSGVNYLVMADGNNGTGGCGTNADNIDICVTTGTGNPITNGGDYACNGGNPCLSGNWTAPCNVNDPVTGAVAAPGCDLAAFNQPGAPANGTWTLTINDICGSDTGALTDWSLDFACGVNSCIDCEAEGGVLNQPDVEGCSGSSDLNLNITPTYNFPNVAPSPASDYSYTFIVSQFGTISSPAPLNGPNLSSLSPGTYEICGLSYENSTPPNLAAYFGMPISVLQTDLASDSAPFCGDVSDDCFTVTIGLPSPPIIIDTAQCISDSFILPDGSICAGAGVCSYSVDTGTGCPQDYQYIVAPIIPENQMLDTMVCEGQCVTIDGIDYCNLVQIIPITDANGCDATLTLFITEIPVSAQVAPPAMLSCSNTTVTLDGSGSNGDSYQWLNDATGATISTAATADVTDPGCYTLIVSNTSVNPACTSTTTVCVTQDGGGIPSQANITGTTPVCVNGAGLYSVTPETGVTYNWTVSANGSVVSGQGTNEITVSWTAGGTADVCVTPNNDCGDGPQTCFSVNIDDVPDNPVINGDAPVCPNGTGSYSVNADPNATNYNWTVPSGASINSGQGTESINVTFGNATGNICVVAGNDCGNATQQCFPITFFDLPAAAVISGPEDICPGESVIYSTPADVNTSDYNWSVPACASIASGQGTNSITVIWDINCTIGGDVCVDVSNDCGTGQGDCIVVAVGNNVSTPVVSGVDATCLNDTEIYSIPVVANVIAYTWQITGGTILTGQGTTQVEVIWTDAGAGEICATVETDCGISSPGCLNVTVGEAPATPVIFGETPLCAGQSGEYSVAPPLNGDETFLWTISGGGNFSGGNISQSTDINWSAPGNYDVCVEVTNSCGSAQICFPVEIEPGAVSPTLGGPTSVCQNSTEDYFVGDPIAGETYNWTVPAGASIIPGPTSDLISIDWGSSAGGQVCVTATGSCGTSSPTCIDVSTDGVPSLGSVVGATSICAGASDTYSIGALSTATNYTWSADCGTIVAGQGSTEITLEATATCIEINLCVSADTDCGATSNACMLITIDDIPEAVTQIDGASTTCLSETENYCLTPVANADSYTWTVTGGTIISGQGSDCVDVQWDVEGTGQVCAAPVNACGTQNDFCLDVDVNNVTVVPVIDTGAEVCNCDETSATVSNAAGAVTIEWIIPTGATIVSGQGTETVVVNWCNAESADLCVNLTFDCGAVSDCTPITVFATPTPDAGTDEGICGLTYTLNAVNSELGSTGTWSYAGANTVSFNDVNAPNTSVTVSDFGVYSFTWTEDNNGCTASDEVQIAFNDAPVLVDAQIETCNLATGEYTVEFEITGGQAPYFVNNTEITGTNYFSAPIASNVSYSFSVTDANGCGPILVEGVRNCDCSTSAGTMGQELQEVCIGETVTGLPNGDEINDGDDVIQYILHDGNSSIVGTVFDINATGEFALVPPMETGITYYISTIIGNDLGAGTVDQDDPCFRVAVGTPVLFNPLPSGIITGDADICENGSAELSFNLTGAAPFSVVFDGNTLTDQPATFTQTVSPAATSTYELTEVTDANGCTQSVSSIVTITVNTPPVSTVIANANVCNSTDNGNATTLNFNQFVTAGDASGTWEDTGASGATGGFNNMDFSGIAPGSYTFTYTTGAAIAPCENVTYTMVVTVEDCQCPSVETIAPAPLCNDSGTLNLTTLQITNQAGSWTLIDQPVDANATLTGTSFDVSGLPAGDYTFEFTLDNDPPVDCPNSSQQTLTVNQAVNAGIPNDALVFCEGEGSNIDLFAELTDADSGGTWSETSSSASSGGAFNSNTGSFNPNGQTPGTYTFDYTVDATAPCADASASVTVIINPTPIANAGADHTLSCSEPETTIGSASQAGLSYTWESSNGGTISEDEINTSNPTINTGGTYTLTVVDENTGCTNTDVVQISEALDVPTPEFSVSDLSCFGEGNGSITIDSVNGGQAPYVFSVDGENFSTSPFFSGLSVGSYEIIVEDANGCQNILPFEIKQPDELGVEILIATEEGDNTLIFGDSTQLQLQVTPFMPLDSLESIIWSPSDLITCDTCESMWVTPFQTTNFSIIIEDDGCFAEDNLTIFVERETPIFVPNAFSPDNDSNNERLYIFAGSQVKKINQFLIYNRWGEAVHEYYEFLPNNPDFGWDGRYRGELMNTGVFVWYAEIELIDGTIEVYEGDITLFR